MLVWGESRGEPSDGKCAVAYIPLTRAKISGNTLAQEILRHAAFSCFNFGDPNRYQLLNPAAHGGTGSWAICWRIAAEARAGQSANPANGATHYVTRALWNRPPTNPTHAKWFEAPMIAKGTTKWIADVGGHVFATTPWSTHV